MRNFIMLHNRALNLDNVTHIRFDQEKEGLKATVYLTVAYGPFESEPGDQFTLLEFGEDAEQLRRRVTGRAE